MRSRSSDHRFFFKEKCVVDDPKDSLNFEYGRFKASAVGRFTVIAVLVCVFTFAAGVTYFGGNELLGRFIDRRTTASIAN